MSSRRGFTLIELLVVIAIIALLASIIIVSVNSARQKAILAKAQEFDASTYHFLGDTIVGEWDFDECSGTVVHDISGFSDNGTLVNGPTWSTDTPTGQGCSLNFNGTNSYVDINGGAALNVSTAITISMWIKPTNTEGTGIAEHYVLGMSGAGYELSTTRFNPDLTSGWQSLTYNQVFSPGIWYHVAATYDSATGIAKVYVDGVQTNTATWTGTITDAGNLMIGTENGPSYFNGEIDEVRVYSTALTSQAVGKLYAVEAPRYGLAVR